MSSDSPATPPPPSAASAALFAPVRLIRVAVAGILMGTANLIPGVSGGTMVLAMGFYQEFIDSVADITAFRFSLRRILFLGILGGFAIAAILGLAGVILYLLFHYPVVMFALFIGLTLGGAPTMARSLKPWRADVIVATVLGFGLMVGVLLLRQGAGFPHNTAMDVASGVVGATTMVLPGISGSYMLLVMDQYEHVIGAVKERNLRIIVPVGIGAIIGIVGLAHALKWLLRRHARPTIGVLLGILLGSVVGLWPFGKLPGHKALAECSPAQLRTFIADKQIPNIADLPDEQLAEAILLHWDERGQPDYTAGNITRAAIAVALGFIATLALSRLQPGGRSATT